MNKGRLAKLLFFVTALIVVALALTACELAEPVEGSKYYINDNSANALNKDTTTKDQAIDRVTGGITNLREYLDSEVVSSTGYYMGMEFNIDTLDPETLEGGNFRLKIQAHLFTYPYLDEEGNLIYKYYDKSDGQYYDEQNPEGTREKVSAEDIHNEVIKKSDILIEWYNGTTNEMLIGMYFDGLNSNSEDPGNILYLNIQGYKRSFPDFGDTVLYQQLIRLLMSLSVEELLVAGDLQGDAGTSSLESLFDVAVTDNYKVVLNSPVTSVLFYGIAADAVASTITDFIQGIFEPFENKIDPLTLKYLGFKFSVVGSAVINSIASDMQFFTEPDPSGTKEIMTGAYLTFTGAALSGGSIYNYVSDVTFEYGTYPPDGIDLDKDFYTPYEYGKYEFVGNLYIPMINSNFDALIRTDMQRYDNSTNNVFMEYRDIANGELMIGAYYKYEKTFIDISGMEYLYGWIDLNELGFPKVYDESLNLAEALGEMFDFIDESIVSIVDAILSPDKNDKENYLLEYIMDKTSMTEKDPNDIFSKNTVTLTVDMELIKHVLEETGQGTYTTRQIINILDSMLPYSLDQIAIMLGVANAEVMLDNTYFTFTLNVDTNEITIKMLTNVGIEEGEDSLMIFQLDITPVIVGQHVDIAEVNFDGFKPLQQIMTYSATMNGNFIFSAAETVDLSKLLSATIGENSGLNTPYILASDAGLTFELVYDQFVTDHEVEGVLRKQGRSAFELNVWLTGAESSVIIRLASDDVAFNNDVYQNQPERAAELGYVWVSIECVTDKDGIQKIPKVKIREDVFMSSMQAYLDGTSISDDAADLGESEVNLSITSILLALIEDSYVVMEPEQMEITSSNETLQNLFRVKGLIGNIRANAGFTHRVEGLQSIKNDYGMYQVGQFEDMTGNSPYDTVLHDTIPVYFYEDYHGEYSYLEYDLRVDRETGVIQVYEKGGQVSIIRETIEYASDSFFNQEDENNQDISKVRFRYDKVQSFVYMKGENYFYTTYDGEEVQIDDQYVRVEGSVLYIYYLGIKDRVHHLGESEYCYYDTNKALLDENGDFIYIYPERGTKKFLFEYDEESIEITEQAKTQYAPRINGSFMGNIRRYILTITSPILAERSKIIELNNRTFYSDADRDNVLEIYDDDGILIREEPNPIVLYVFEPCEPFPEDIALNMQVNNTVEIYNLPAVFDIAAENITLDGFMDVTEVTIAPGTMGEKTFPVRVIVTNRKILTDDKVSVYTGTTDYLTQDVPVVDSITIDPYDYILAKNEFFMDINNYNPDQYGAESVDGQDPEYLRVFKEKEVEFINKFFSSYEFTIEFDPDNYLVNNEVKEEYIATSYNNVQDGTTYNWSFDRYEDGNYTEDKISTVASGGDTATVLYVHTYFKGQLIALEVNVEQRILSHIKFSEDDDFDPVKANPGKNPGDAGYVYGHYVANYFDEASYTIPVNPIFVFTDGANHYYEKVFDMSYVSGLNNTGNYVINPMYTLTWYNPQITYIGVNGSYYYEDDGSGNEVLVNRPFDIANVITDENGTIIGEEAPTKLYDTDITSTSVNWFDLLAIYKPERQMGQYTGNYIKIPLISGDATYSGFMTTVLYITAECPRLDIAQATSSSGEVIQEADDEDTDTNGNKVVFTPDAVQIGTNTPGYYLIDPLDADTLVIPTDAVIHFTDGEDMTATHKFSNIEWRATFAKNDEGEYFGEGSLTNDSGVEVLRYEDGKYIFNLPTDEPLTTKIMARIGSEVSGYEYITVCIKVLSKDPQEVEFYLGSSPSGTKISGIERTDVNIALDGESITEKAFYTYYVNTFADFRLPDYIKAYFGVNKDRSEYYDVTWTLADGSKKYFFAPDSVRNMIAVIGTGDITITIYLSVVVANIQIEEIVLTGDISGYYVQVGDHGNYKRIGELLQADYNTAEMGLYEIYELINEKYILISMGQAADNGVPAGKIGLYRKEGTDYVLYTDMYPYDFIKAAYSKMNISFEDGQPVTLEDITEYEADFYNEDSGVERSRKLGEVLTYSYSYDNASAKNVINVDMIYRDGSVSYLIKQENGFVKLYKDGNYAKSVTVEEIIIAYTYLILSEDIDDRTVSKIVTSSGETDISADNLTLKNLYVYERGAIKWIYEGQEFGFTRLEFADGSSMSYYELNYRLTYFNAHRRSYAVTSVTDKVVEIEDFEGIFYVNDVVKGKDFSEKDKYKIGLGTGEGSYDITLRLIFDGGYRMNSDDEAAIDVEVKPYSQAGYAQYGANGYILGEELSAEIGAEKQDGLGKTDAFYYGPAYGASYPTLNRWYVESSSFAEVAVGSFIEVIPQSVVYSTKSGTITVSCLTSEGFRVRRTLNFRGVPESIDEYNSTNTSGLLIRSGTINIQDIYDYMPLTTYFGGTGYLPTSLTLELGESTVNVSNVRWTINPSWYGNTVIEGDQVVGTGQLDRMTYTGTYNNATGLTDKYTMATAEILGWEETVGGQKVYHDRITIKLYISIESAEIVDLPWQEGFIGLDTTSVKFDDNTRKHYVEVDAFNDMNNSYNSDGYFTLPENIATYYLSNRSHVFYGVEYKFNDIPVSGIPFNVKGIDTETLAATLGVPVSALDKSYIDLTVDLGLSQTLDIRFRFYDKTVDSVTAVISPDDEVIRAEIAEAMSAVSEGLEGELLDKFNQTRIKVNIENMYAQAKSAAESVTEVSAADIYGNMTEAQIKDKLLEAWLALLPYDLTSEVEDGKKNDVYDDEQCWNFAIAVLNAEAETLAAQYAPALFRILNNSSMSSTQQQNNIALQLSNFYTQLHNNSYDRIISDYVKLELGWAFNDYIVGESAEFIGYASYYKNVFEASYDYDYVIREIYRIREYFIGNGIYSETDEGVYELYEQILTDALNEAERVAKSRVSASETVYNKVRNIVDIKLGLIERGGSVYKPLNEDIAYFARNYAYTDKAEMRRSLQKLITEAFDFSYTETTALPNEIAELYPVIVSDNIDAIQNFSVTVTAIRRNLTTSVDISTMLDTILTRGVTNFVEGVLMESRIMREIKKVQALNTENGYYYIDPYYDYRVVPTKLVAEFDEASGGFAYTFDVAWTNDNVSGKVNYSGNERDDVYGYVYAFFNAYNMYVDNDLLGSYLDTVSETIEGKTWAEIKSENASEYNRMTILEGMVSSFFEDITDENKITLYKYYRAGKSLVKESEENLAAAGIDAERVERDYYLHKFTELTANLYNTVTEELQTVSLIVKVNDRTLPQGELIVIDDEGKTVTRVNVEKPFEYSVADLPNKINVNGEILEVVWRDVSINPLGNLNASTHTVYGNIKNADGQQVSIELYVSKWEFVGISKEVDGVWTEMNPINFYFSHSLQYSAEDSYLVKFNVYTLGSDGKTTVEYEEVEFYPEDSEMLVNSTNDNEMDKVEGRKNYVIYWDEMSVSTALNNNSSSVEGDLLLGNERVGQHNITTLGGSSASVPKRAYYSSENMFVEKLALSELDTDGDGTPDAVYGLSGEVPIVTDIRGTLPMTGDILLRQSNINFDPDLLKVRLLWNRSYESAILNLSSFIGYVYPDIEGEARTAYAINLIMNYDRTEAEEAQLIEDAKAYIKYINPGQNLTEAQLLDEAKKLLMINERYDFAANPNALRGGSTINQTVTVLVRYGESSYVYEKTMKVKLLFSDYNPLAYYSYSTATGGYNEIPSVTASTAPDEVYIGVRTVYWDEANGQNGYASENLASPYNAITETDYKLLDARNSEGLVNGTNYVQSKGHRLIKVTDIVYEESPRDGKMRSVSFVIDGITYKSDLIAIPVA